MIKTFKYWHTWFPPPVIFCDHIHSIEKVLPKFFQIVRLWKTTWNSGYNNILHVWSDLLWFWGGGKERSGQSVNRKPSLNYMDITKNCVNVSVSFILNQLFVSWGHRVGAKLGIGGRMCSGGMAWEAGHFCSPFQGQSIQSDSMDGIPVHSMQSRSGDKYKVSLCSTFLETQRRVHFNLVAHRNFIKYACTTVQHAM